MVRVQVGPPLKPLFLRGFLFYSSVNTESRTNSRTTLSHKEFGGNFFHFSMISKIISIPHFLYDLN